MVNPVKLLAHANQAWRHHDNVRGPARKLACRAARHAGVAALQVVVCVWRERAGCGEECGAGNARHIDDAAGHGLGQQALLRDIGVAGRQGRLVSLDGERNRPAVPGPSDHDKDIDPGAAVLEEIDLQNGRNG